MSFLDFFKKVRPQATDLSKFGYDRLGGEALNKQHIYPSDLFTPGVEPYILFLVRDGVASNAPIKKRVALYMPPTINVSYGAQYENIEMTLFQYQDLGVNVGGALTALQEGNSAEFAKQMGPLISKGAVSGLDYFAGGNFSDQYDRMKGRVVNPHMGLLFKGMDLRQFTFNFQLMARNQKESEAIQEIITQFKLAMHPDDSGKEGARWLGYPDNFNIGLFSPANKYLFNFNTCVLKGMNVDYAGSGIPSFLTSTGAPVDIRMSLTFQELTMVTRQDITNRNL